MKSGILKEGRLKAEINDKRLYCLRQANREVLRRQPRRVSGRRATLEEVDGLTPEGAEQPTYYEMLRRRTSSSSCWAAAEASAAAVKDALLAELSAIDRAPLPGQGRTSPCPGGSRCGRWSSSTRAQAKLCMLFTLGQPMPA